MYNALTNFIHITHRQCRKTGERFSRVLSHHEKHDKFTKKKNIYIPLYKYLCMYINIHNRYIQIV